MKKLLSLLLALQFVIVSSAFAQEDEDIIKSTQNDIILVGAAGVGGAILGLSTLSFTDKPSKHVSNIWTGAAIGVIAGVIWVVYDSAAKGSEDLQSSKEFNSLERVAWHDQNSENLTFQNTVVSSQLWQLSF